MFMNHLMAYSIISNLETEKSHNAAHRAETGH